MKQLTLIFSLVISSLLFSHCFPKKSKKTFAGEIVQTNPSLEKEEKEDGIRESQEMEFEMTKDISLGYIPASRLVNAYTRLVAERKAGIPNRISALSWSERGPNSDIPGPGNGNTRGPGNNAVTGGRTRAIWVDLADATNKTVWAGSVSGGIWKTTDISAAPANWSLVNDFLGNLAVTSICQNPSNTNIMYFATGERNNNSDAVRGGGVWKSTDHGSTWNLLPATTNFWNVSKIACDGAGNLYVGTSGNGFGLQRSTDGGLTWTEITPRTPSRGTRITEVRISSTGRMHVTKGFFGSPTNQSGYFYTDNPATVDSTGWISPVTPFPNVEFNCELTVSGNMLYTLPANSDYLTPQIYKSFDGGANWTPTISSPPSTSTEPSINTGQGWYDLAIGVDPNDPNHVIAGGLNLYSTADGGTTWTQTARWIGTTTPYVHADHHTVVWNGTQVLVGTDGGIFYSSDNGVNFSDRNVGLNIKQFYSCAIHPTLVNYFLAGSQDNGTHQLSAAGLGSSIEVLGGDGGFVHIDENEPQYQFAATTRGQYRRSSNGGTSWSSVNYSSTAGLFINPTDYDDINNRMYTSAAAGTYVRWDNPQTGSTFTSVSISSATTGSVVSVKVSPYKSNTVFFGSSNGRVVKVDGAHSESPVVTNLTGSSMPVSTVSSINTGTSNDFLLATFSNYGAAHVWMSSNGGGSAGWTNISGNLPDIPVRWGMFYPENNDKAIIATDLGVFETDDINGSSTVWVQNNTFPSVRTNMLQYRATDHTLLAATHGRGLWTTVIPSSIPYVRFESSYTYGRVNPEAGTVSSGCRNYTDYIVKMHIDAAPVGDAKITLSIAAGGTAIEGIDYDISTNGDFSSPSKQLSFAGGSAIDQPITVRVYDDAEIESTETFTINYSIASGTNAVAAPSSSAFTFQIGDNDFAPLPEGPGNATIGNGNFGSYVQPFRGSYAKAKSQYIYTAEELSAAGIVAGNIDALGFNVTSKGSTIPYSGLTVSLKNTSSTTLNAGSGFETGATLCYFSSYSIVSGVNTLAFNYGSFVWDGTSNLLVEICYDNADNSGKADDNVSSNTTADQKCLWGRVAAGGSGCTLPGTFDGVGSPIAYVRPNIILNATLPNNTIETVLNVTKTVNVAGNGFYYFYSPSNNKIISNLSSASASLGCVTSTIFEAGTAWQNFYTGQRSQKVFNETISSNANATYTIGLYYTLAELNGKTPGTLKIAGTTAATMAAADATNTTLYAATVTAYGGGFLYTATVSGNGKFFLVSDNVSAISNVSRRDENLVRLLQNPVKFSIPLMINNQQRQKVTASLFTVTGQLLSRWELGRVDANVILPLSGNIAANGMYILRIDAGNKTQSIQVITQ